MQTITDGFKAQFPKSVKLGLGPVVGGAPGFDQDDVRKMLGQARFNKLMAKVKSVFSCGHRVDDTGVEIHCLYAQDVESFLAAGG